MIIGCSKIDLTFNITDYYEYEENDCDQDFLMIKTTIIKHSRCLLKK